MLRGGNRDGAGRPRRQSLTTIPVSLDVRDLRRRGVFNHNEVEVTITRSDGMNVRAHFQGNFVELTYRFRFDQGWGDVNDTVRIEHTPCNYGGNRPWLRCPRCERRIAVLYLWGWPACRTCASLSYPSQSETAFERSVRRLEKIDSRLPQSVDVGRVQKPKWMRWPTFSELKPKFSLLGPWGLLHFDPKEYPVTQAELAGFKGLAEQCGVTFCFLSTWEEPHQDKDLLSIFK